MPPIETCPVIVGRSADIKPEWLLEHQAASVREKRRRERLAAVNEKQGKHIRAIGRVLEDVLARRPNAEHAAEGVTEEEMGELFAHMKAAGLDTRNVFARDKNGEIPVFRTVEDTERVGKEKGGLRAKAAKLLNFERLLLNTRFGHNPIAGIVVSIMEKRGVIENGLMRDLTNDAPFVEMIERIEKADRSGLTRIAAERFEAARAAEAGLTLPEGNMWLLRKHAVGASMGLYDDDIASHLAARIILDKNKLRKNHTKETFFEKYGGDYITLKDGTRNS